MVTRINRSLFAAAAVAVTAIAGVANADIYIWNISLSGPAESPPNASPGTGTATITLDSTLHTLRVQSAFSGLTGNTTASHIHASGSMVPFTGTAGVATQTPSFAGFPLGVSAGSMDTTFNLTLASSWNAAYVTANGGTTASAETAFLSAMLTGRAYLNIHTSTFGGGEIRGFIPAPSAAAALGLGGLLVARRRR